MLSVQANDVENFVCAFFVKIGVTTLPAFSILIGEGTLSHALGYGIILPSPIGVELMEFPARMMYALSRKCGSTIARKLVN